VLVVASAVGLVALGVCAMALAAGPVKGATYSGPLSGSASETVSFKVSSNGKKVTKLRLSPFIPNTCGNGGPPPTEISAPAKITNGKFTGTVVTKATDGSITAKAVVTGKFLRGRKEKGTVKTTLPNASNCNGSFTYTTAAQ
jgi:hypothetical protein